MKETETFHNKLAKDNNMTDNISSNKTPTLTRRHRKKLQPHLVAAAVIVLYLFSTISTLSKPHPT